MTGSTDLAVIAAQLPAHLRNAKSTASAEFTGGMAQGLPLSLIHI